MEFRLANCGNCKEAGLEKLSDGWLACPACGLEFPPCEDCQSAPAIVNEYGAGDGKLTKCAECYNRATQEEIEQENTMDPKQALLDARSYLLAFNKPAARECLREYWEWRRKGGFEPILAIKCDFPKDWTERGDEYARTLTNNMRCKREEIVALITLEAR
jgi:uncharacterized Zn ribbon protein